MNINDLYDIPPGVGMQLELSPIVLAFPPFKKVIDSRKKSDYGLAIKEIEYILWRNHWSTPYKVYGDRIESAVKRDIFDDENYSLSGEAKEAERRFIEEFQTNEVLIMLESARIGIQATTDFYRDVNDNKGKYDPMYIVKVTKELGNLHKSLDTLEKAAKSKVVYGNKIRGGSELNDFEVPKFNQ